MGKRVALMGLMALAIALGFQNCGKVHFDTPSTTAQSNAGGGDGGGGTLGVCDGKSCDLTPLTTRPAVTTILLALGEEANQQLVVKAVSSQLIAETVIRYSSPKSNPKILFVQDSTAANENPEDSAYAANVLLSRYSVTSIIAPATGITSADLDGYDVVWFNNPGKPMASEASAEALKAFAGGVILQGDDLSWGETFALDDLTGLHMIDNGTSVTCDVNTYHTDNDVASQFAVTLNAAKFTGSDADNIVFHYGNDIDNTSPVRPDLEVLATARVDAADCTVDRPAIVRYLK